MSVAAPARKSAFLKRVLNPLTNAFVRRPSAKVRQVVLAKGEEANGGKRIVSKEMIRLVDIDCSQRLAADAGDIWRPFIEADDDAASLYSQDSFVHVTLDDAESMAPEKEDVWTEVDHESIDDDDETKCSSESATLADEETGMYSFDSFCSQEDDDRDVVLEKLILARSASSLIWS